MFDDIKMDLTLFKSRVVLVTGGTGSFGKAFAKLLLNNVADVKLIIFSRDEMKQWDMAAEYPDDGRIRFFLGDVRDGDRLRRAFKGVDFVIHAAATKIVPTAEYNPFECVKTNIIGAMNVVDASIDMGVEAVVALSTDKASSPINLYGASKLTSDKLFVSGNNYSAGGSRMAVVRYGNVMGSRGSVIPHFMRAAPHGTLTITDPRMTRFMISLDEGIDLVCTAFRQMKGGEIFVRKIPSMNIMEIAKAVAPDCATKVVGIRPGEKLHEQMIGVDDACYTYSYDKYYKILPNINEWYKDPERIGDGEPVPPDFHYTSDDNVAWMDVPTLREWIVNNRHLLLNGAP